MRKITVTEENFEKVLKKLQNICNKYRMFEFYRVLSDNMIELEEFKKFRRNSIGFKDHVLIYANKNGERMEKIKEIFCS